MSALLDETNPLDANRVAIANYDADGYDYRRYWHGREYEDWAEARVIRKWLRPGGVVPWLVDLGGGFGRHIPHYQAFAKHIVLVDYSWTNLHAAEALFMQSPGLMERVFLVRANLYHLPFCHGAFDTGTTVRVLHHLADAPAALKEMGRVIRHRWLLDVPNRHHLRARLRALCNGELNVGARREPHEIGTPSDPYRNYHVGAVRDQLHALGWQSRVAASVANLRGWERVCPASLREVTRPGVYSIERLAQPLGRTWWGPSQWLWLTRRGSTGTIRADVGHAVAHRPGNDAADGASSGSAPSFASRLRCPRCTGTLDWRGESAHCGACDAVYNRQGHIWDFAVR